jgi:hypothetical protein
MLFLLALPSLEDTFGECLRSRSSMKVGMKLLKQSISTFSEKDGHKTMTISGIQVLIV